MFRTFLISTLTLISALAATPAAPAQGITIPFPFTVPVRPTSFATALPYVQMVHQVLDVLTTRESPPSERAKLAASESRSEWVVHRIRANVWVERSSSNYLGQIGVRVYLPCQVEFSLDLSAMRYGQMKYDAAHKLLIVELPQIQIREPVPLLAEMKVEPQYKGLRNAVLDAEKMRHLQDELVKGDYMPAAREVAMGVHDYAQRKARDQVQEFLQGVFRLANTDIEVVVR